MRSARVVDPRAAPTRRTEEAPPAPQHPIDLLQRLQATAGNHAVLSLLASPSERARAMFGGVTLAEKPDHFPMGMGVAIPKGGTFRAPEADFDMAGRNAQVKVKEPTEPDWTIRVAPPTGEQDAYELDGFTTVSNEMISGGGGGQAAKVANALLDRSVPQAKPGAYRVAIMFPAEFHSQVSLVEEEHADDFRQAHKLMRELHGALAAFASGLGGAAAGGSGIDPELLEKHRTEVDRDAPDDATLVDDFALPMLKSLPAVKLKAGGTAELPAYDARYSNRKERIAAIVGEMDMSDLRQKVVERLAEQESDYAATATSSPLQAAYDAMRAKVREVQPKFVPPAMTSKSADNFSSAATKHWADAYNHLIGLSKQRDMLRWHSGRLRVRAVQPIERGQGRILLETGPSDKFQLRQDSAEWIQPTNRLYAEPVNWDIHDPWK